ARLRPEDARAIGEKRNGLRVLVYELEKLADISRQFVVEGLRGDDGRVASRPQTAVAGFEEVQGQFFLAGEMFIQRRVGVAALLGNDANGRGGEALLAEQLHRRAEDLSLGRRV